MTQDKDSGAPAGRDLRLMACDPEDLAVHAAHVQDAILRVGDMIYLPREKRFVLSLKRFDWLARSRARRKGRRRGCISNMCARPRCRASGRTGPTTFFICWMSNSSPATRPAAA